MEKKVKKVIVTVCFCLLFGVPLASYGQSSYGQHLPDALNLVSNLLITLNNSYGSPASINWNAAPDTAALTECSSFVTLLLKHSYGWDNTFFINWMGSSSPNAATYHDKIAAANPTAGGWTQIFDITAVQPGDIIAIKYLPGYTTPNATGHVMVVQSAPVENLNPNPPFGNGTSPIVAGTLQYKLQVVDSSDSYHGSTDSRYKSGHPGGIGQDGYFRIYIDQNTHQIVGYTWSLYSNSTYYNQSQRNLVIGRLS